MEFENTNEVEIIPCCWLLDKNRCVWPDNWKSTKTSIAIKEKVLPDSSFTTYGVSKILYETGTNNLDHLLVVMKNSKIYSVAMTE